MIPLKTLTGCPIIRLLSRLCLLAILLTGAQQALAQASGTDPVQLVEITVRDAIAEVRENEALYINNGARLQAMIEERVAPYFDFERMAQLAVARNWQNATPAERTELTEQFRTLLIRSYANVSYDYRTELPNIRITPRDVRENRAVIRAEVAGGVRRSAVIDIRMEDRGQGWKVIDVMVDGVSLIVNYRASFAYEIEQGGFSRLIATLRAENGQN